MIRAEINLFIYLLPIILLRETDGAPKLPNIGYLGNGYDVMYANPLADTVDPGFRVPVYKMNKYNGNTTADGIYSIPVGTDVKMCESCDLSFNTNIIVDIATYQKLLSIRASVGFNYNGAAFSASSDYQSMENHISTNNAIYITSFATCTIYCANILYYDPPALSTNFVHAIENAPLDNLEYYKKIIQQFGTHIVSGISMGGLYAQNSEFHSSGFQELVSNEINIGVAASFSALIAAGAVGAMTKSQQQLGEYFSNTAYSQEQHSIGSRLPPDGSVYTWASNVTIDPMPMQITKLQSLSELLTPQIFPNDANITMKQDMLSNALHSYCQDLQSQNITSCVPPKPCTTIYYPTVIVNINNNSVYYPWDNCWNGLSSGCGMPAAQAYCENEKKGLIASSFGPRIYVGSTYVGGAPNPYV